MSNAIRTPETRQTRRVLFVVSRERPDRYESLANAFSGDDDVRIIFDRRRAERRRRSAETPVSQAIQPPVTDRRRRDRRSDVRAQGLLTRGWIRVQLADPLPG
jgi:hypothetical protein